MKEVHSKTRYLFTLLLFSIFILSACSKWVIPSNLPGTYTGKQRVLIRYDRGGQYIYRDNNVMMSLFIDKKGNVCGMVGGATFEGCMVSQNRGWIERQLGIKTDFLIKGMLIGKTFDEDTLVNKDISIPFNSANGELKGSLFLMTKGDSFPIISILKLQKM
jgi:hypothetical protein